MPTHTRPRGRPRHTIPPINFDRGNLSAARDDLTYFYPADSSWFIASGDDVLLGGPFPTFGDLLTWAVEKEFVEPKLLSVHDDEFCAPFNFPR